MTALSARRGTLTQIAYMKQAHPSFGYGRTSDFRSHVGLAQLIGVTTPARFYRAVVGDGQDPGKGRVDMRW